MERSVLAESRHVHWASQLHSEYRSTYRWHDFKSDSQQAQQGGVVKQPAPLPPSALPFSRSPMEPAMPRRKKYPGLAYKANEFFDPAPVDDIRPQQPSTFDRARSAERNDGARAGRRSKSEGPRQTRWTDTVEPKGTTAVGEVVIKGRETGSTEYRKQFAWPKDTDSTPRKSSSMGALKKAAAADGSTEAEPLMNHIDDHHHDQPKKYIEDYLWNGQTAGTQRKSTFRSALSAFISNGEDRSKDNRKRYKSEYKKKFRPFSQYVYEASKGTFTKCRGSKGNSGVNDEGASERMLSDVAEGGPGEEGSGAPEGRGSDSWYHEMLDLRKRAGEYKYRGWGTELAPDHITQLYNKQNELWYQVSRRSSLSALSLASTNHKALPRDEKDGKESRNHSPKKFRSFRSAPHQSIHAKIQETKGLDRSPHKTSPQKQRKKLQGHSFDEAAVQDANKTGEIKTEFKSPRRRPRSADPAPVPAFKQHLPNGHEQLPRPHKPTEDEVPSHRSASVAKDHFFDDSPVVKSPPEPTRVKSPEQMNMRSPDPVNWTVPLDTGKTFTVTQNVKSDDTVKRPSSEFKGTSLAEDGPRAIKPEEIVPVHHQMSPIRTLKKSESPTGSKRIDKTPTTPISLTPIDETKALDIIQVVNGVNSNQLTPENPTTDSIKTEPKADVIKKSIEATQIAPGIVDTTLVNDTTNNGGLTAAEVLDRARTRFDKFWGKKEENDNV